MSLFLGSGATDGGAGVHSWIDRTLRELTGPYIHFKESETQRNKRNAFQAPLDIEKYCC